MLRLTAMRRWVPNYFRNAPRRAARHHRGAARGTSPPASRSVAASGGAASSTQYVSTDVPPSVLYRPVTTQPPVHRGVTWGLVDRARALLERVERVKEGRADDVTGVQCVNFCALAEVFGPLRSLLPNVADPALPRRTLVVVPDAMTATPEAVVRGTSDGGGSDKSAQEGTRSVDDAGTREGLSLNELRVLLQLYHAVACDDGALLRQLLGELRHRIVLLARRRPRVALAAEEAHALPALLLTLTELGLIEEDVLQAIVGVAEPQVRPRAGATPEVDRASSTPHAAGLLQRRQLSRCTEHELVVLLVAWHRFGLHHDAVFARTVGVLHWRLRHSAALRSFSRAMRLVERRVAPHRPPSPDAATDAPVLSSLCAEMPPPPGHARFSAPLLVEALTALSLSTFRPKDVVTFLADALVVTAVQGMTGRSGAPSASGAAREDETMTRSHHLLRAAKLCECMNGTETLLACAFAWSCAASGKGVVVEGGEVGEVPSERKVFYDSVTADLIKLRHVV